MKNHRNLVNMLDNIIDKIRRMKVVMLDDILNISDLYEDPRLLLKYLEHLYELNAFRIWFNDRYVINTFVGDHYEYLIIPNIYYCGCNSRYPLAQLKRRICPHIITFKILDALGLINEIHLNEEDFEPTLEEILYLE